jgi:hypothetical protein
MQMLATTLQVRIESDNQGLSFTRRPIAPAGKRYAFRHTSREGDAAVFELEDAPASAVCRFGMVRAYPQDS